MNMIATLFIGRLMSVDRRAPSQMRRAFRLHPLDDDEHCHVVDYCCVRDTDRLHCRASSAVRGVHRHRHYRCVRVAVD